MRYSVPMELHVHADSAQDALNIAYWTAEACTGLYDDSENGPSHLHLAADRVSDVDEIGD